MQFIPTSYPTPKASKKIPIYDIAISVIEYENKVLITKDRIQSFYLVCGNFQEEKLKKMKQL